MIFQESKRLEAVPPYLFSEIDRIIQEKKSRGIDVISLGIGDPDIPTPEIIIKKLSEQAANPENHRYPSTYGLMYFKKAVSSYYKRRFNVDVDPESEVITLWGSKEGIANIAYTFINPGDLVLVPDPGYLVYSIGTMFAGGNSVTMPLREENGFKVDFNAINKKDAQEAKIMHLNYPNNPTSATCEIDFFNKAVDFATNNEIIICHDNAYCDVFFNELKRPVSLLNSKNSLEVGIEFNSLSKTFNMTGWRIAFAVGNRDIIASLGKYKTNVDSGVFNAIQCAAAEGLNNYEKLVPRNISIYKKRREIIFKTLDNIGLEYFKSDATIYIWAKVPEGYTSGSFAELLLNNADVVVTPGSAFGKMGEGFFRISLTLPDQRLAEALERIGKVL